MKNKLLLLFSLISLAISGQTNPVVTKTGNLGIIQEQRTGMSNDSVLKVPVRGHAAYAPALPMKGRIQVNSETSRLEFHDSIDWRPVATDFSLYDRMYTIKYPEELPWRPYQIYRYKTSDWKINATPFETNFEKDFANATPYYISPDGNDSNNGLTPATAKRTILSAYNAGGSLFLVSEGKHLGDVLQGLTVDRDIAIIGTGDKTFLTGKNTTPVWTTYNAIYTTTASSARNMVDYKHIDQFGFPLSPKRLNSIAEVEATPNSWYSSGSAVYFRAIDDREPDADIELYLPLASSTTTLKASNGHIYFKDITFIGRGGSGTNEAGNGNLTITGIGTPTVKAFIKDCKFVHGQYEGYRINNVSESYVENCYAYGNNFDGFNYKSSLITNHKFVEYNCKSIRNGYFGNSTTDNVNGSSSHNGGIGIRINGIYSENYGPNLPDVGAGAMTYNIGTTATDSRGLETSPDVNGGNFDYVIGDGNGTLPVTTQMWCIDCYSEGSDESFKARLNGQITVINSVYSAPTDGDVIIEQDIDSNYVLSDYTLDTSSFPIFKKEKEVNPFKDINNISIPYGSMPIISPTTGEQAVIGENGNIVWDENIGQYRYVFTMGTSPLSALGVWVYTSTSLTGEAGTWSAPVKITTTPSEDPDLKIEGNTYYLFVENKETRTDHGTQAGIALWKGADIENLVFQGIVLDYTADIGAWDYVAVSSPTLIKEGDTWYMFFEGQNGSNQRGIIGIATASSLDGPWTKLAENPIIVGKQYDEDGVLQWQYSIVPDDIEKIGDTYYLSCHAENSDGYAATILTSKSLTEGWTDYKRGWISMDALNNDFNGSGVYFFRKDGNVYPIVNYTDPLTEVEGFYIGEFNNKVTDKWSYNRVNTCTGASALFAGGRNEIVVAALTANRVWDLRSDKSSAAGYRKIIINESAYTATLTPLTGVTINGGTSGIAIPPNSTLEIYTTGVDTWAVVPKITIDATPTDGSNNAVSSNGTFDAILAAITNIGFSTNPISTSDLNTITQSGLYIPSSSAATGLPVANAAISIFHMNQTSTAATQMAIRAATGDFWWRAKAGGTWGSWNLTASTTYADAKVADNLTASTTVAPSKTAVNTALALKANLASPTFTGTPAAPTATVGTNTTQLATTAFVQGEINALTVTNLSITTAQTASDLNTLYPSARAGFMVICPNVGVGGAREYVKTNETGQWSEKVITILNP